MRLRRRMPPELQPTLDAFVSVVAHVERGKSALTESMPSTRFAGRPLAESLLEFEEELAAAAAAMPAWRRPELEAVWLDADAGLRASMQLADRLRTDAPDPGGFEGLIAVIGELLAPLEAFAPARDALLGLRT
jgi:hypothetical protein